MAKSAKSVDVNDGKMRCTWAARDPILATYHDREWGQPIRTDAGHLKRIALEIFQCGLSWKIVLVKTPALQAAFHEFDPARVAAMTQRDVDRLCQNADIIRNRKKIEATIANSKAFVELAAEHGSYIKWLKR
jgi:DNA-3-methyladenine glycosylase I